MQKLTRMLILVILWGFSTNLLTAQTTILDQSLLTQQSFDTFSAFSVTGSQSWVNSSQYGAVCSGYVAGQSYENEDWLISPAMNLSQIENVNLTFRHTRGSGSVLNVGVAEGWYKVFATADYTGDPTTTQWVELAGFNQDIPVAWQYVASGQLLIPDEVKTENTRIAFRYLSAAGQSATWEIKNVKVTGGPPGVDPNPGVFKITNWNTEWLGCTQFGPFDESLQISNVASAMLEMNSDIYCLQEVSNTVANPSIETLVSFLGSDQWGGSIAPSNTGDCSQRQGIIYKKSKVELVSSEELSNGVPGQGNSYYYNWASGRFPALYNVNLLAGSTIIPVSLVNIHAKSEDGNAMSYTRRLGGSQGLKTILDLATFNSRNLVIIGDFNDYLNGTTSAACACTDSPFKNFVDDQANYSPITQNLTNISGTSPIIEHIILSNELSGNVISNSVTREFAVTQSITNFNFTTSNHIPVSATLQFSLLGNSQFLPESDSSLSIYPNPVKDHLTFDVTGINDNTSITIHDLQGRQIQYEKLSANSVSVAALPAGIYLLKVGNYWAKFVKE